MYNMNKYFLILIVSFFQVRLFSQNYHGGVIDELFMINAQGVYATAMTEEDIEYIIKINEDFKDARGRPLISELVIQKLVNLMPNEYAYNNLNQDIKDAKTGLGWSVNDIIILTVENNRISKVETYTTVQVDIYDFRRAIYSNLSRYYGEFPVLIMSTLGEEIFMWPYVAVTIHDPERIYKKEPLRNGYIKIEYKRYR